MSTPSIQELFYARVLARSSAAKRKPLKLTIPDVQGVTVLVQTAEVNTDRETLLKVTETVPAASDTAFTKDDGVKRSRRVVHEAGEQSQGIVADIFTIAAIHQGKATADAFKSEEAAADAGKAGEVNATDATEPTADATAEKPTEPTAEKPTEPTAEKPTEPTEPTAEKPTEPTEPTAEKSKRKGRNPSA